MNAVYFFRNVDFQNTATLNPVDILCACRPHLRRISVLHLILQNGRQLPRPLLSRMYDAIEDYNKSKQRDDQRPRWGIHMSEAHLAAIADTQVPPDVRREPSAPAKANQRQHQSRALLQVRRHHHRRQRIKQKLHLRQNKLQRLHHGGVEQTTGKVAGPIHTVAAIGTIQDTTEEETGDKFNRPLHRS